MTKKLRFIPLFVFSVSLLAGCSLDANPPVSGGSELMTAINYNEKQRIIYSLDKSYKTPGGKVINKGDYKPFWQFVQQHLGIVLKEHPGAANSGEKKSVAYFRYNWLNKPYADLTMGTVNEITKYAMSGNNPTILDLKEYMFAKDENGKYIIEDGKLKKKGSTYKELSHLADFLIANPGVITSITTTKHSHPDQGAMYFIPYFDGFDDTEKMMMVRQDYITRLLDATDAEVNKFSNDTSILGGDGAKYHQSYEPFLKDEQYSIPLPDVDDSGEFIGGQPGTKPFTKKIPKDGNIIEQQNKLIKNNNASSKTLVRQFRTYFNDRYGEPGDAQCIFKKYSDLFLGHKACYDTDELIALMRIVKVSAKTLYGESDDKEMVPWFPTEWTNMRSADLYRWAGQLFGVRGTESRTGYLYLNGKNSFNADKIHDCRGDKEMHNLLEILRNLYKEGLLMQDFDSQTATGTTNRLFNEQLILEYRKDEDKKNKKYHGFMEYETVSTESKLNDRVYIPKDNEIDLVTEDKTIFAPMIGAVTKWDTDNKEDDKGEKRDTYMQFTESWKSAKTSALCLNADLANNDAKRESAFKLIDYIFSPSGRAAYNFGPSDGGGPEGSEHGSPEYGYYYGGTFNANGDFIAANPGESVTYKGHTIPKFTDGAVEQNKTIDGVSRQCVGVTLPFGFEKMNGMTFQTIRNDLKETKKSTTKDSVTRINKAFECGSYKHVCIKEPEVEYPELASEFTSHPEKKAFYRIIPAAFCLTDGQNTDIARILDKTKLGSMYTDDNQSQFNIWDDYVMGKKSASAPEFDKYLETVNGPWECPKLVTYYQYAYEMMV